MTNHYETNTKFSITNFTAYGIIVPVQEVVAVIVVVVVAAVVVAAVLLAVGCPAVAVDIAAHQSSACPATGQCSALGWGVSVAPSDAGCPSAAAGGAAPTVACSAATGSPNWCCQQDLPEAIPEAQH